MSYFLSMHDRFCPKNRTIYDQLSGIQIARTASKDICYKEY